MIKKIMLICLFSIMGVLLVACQGNDDGSSVEKETDTESTLEQANDTESSVEKENNAQVVKYENDRIAFQYKSDWSVDEKEHKVTLTDKEDSVVVIEVVDDDSEDIAKPNDERVAEYEATLKKEADDGKVTKNTKTYEDKNGNMWDGVTYEYTLNGKDMDSGIFYIVAGENNFIITTYTTSSNDEGIAEIIKSIESKMYESGESEGK